MIAQQRSEEQRRRMVIQLYIHSAMVGDQPVGPLRLVADATIGDVEDKVMTMMMMMMVMMMMMMMMNRHADARIVRVL